MGYFKNHLATLVMGVFAAIMTALWPYFNGFAPVLDFIFLMAVPISWFLVVVLWLAQVSTDYMHGSGHDKSDHGTGDAQTAPIIRTEGTPTDALTGSILNGDQTSDTKSKQAVG